jgi:hypothetical protein
METLYRIFGPPHEFLHWVALRLIGRRAVRVTGRYIDIPADLTRNQYVFVAGLPALVFWGLALGGMLWVINALDVWGMVIGFVLFSLGTLAGLGTLGDLSLILARLEAEEER